MRSGRVQQYNRLPSHHRVGSGGERRVDVVARPVRPVVGAGAARRCARALLYGWKVAFITATGAIAALAITFADYAISLFEIGDAWSLPIAVAAIVFLSGVNYFGIKFGSLTQNVFTVLKLGALAGLARPEPEARGHKPRDRKSVV